MSYLLKMHYGISWSPSFDQSVSLIIKGLKERFASDPLFQRRFVSQEAALEAVGIYYLPDLPDEYSLAVREIVDEYVSKGPAAYEGVAAPHAWKDCYAELVEFQRLLHERLPPARDLSGEAGHR